MKHICKALFALLVLITSPVHAEEGLDALSYMKGQWFASGAFYEEGKLGEPSVKKRATADTVLGGAFIRLDAPINFSGSEFQFEVTFSYDRFHDNYRLVFLDDLNGYIDVYVGTLQDGVLSVSNADTDTHFPDGQGGVVMAKLDIEKSTEGFVLNAFLASAKEGPYTPYMRLEFTRLPGR